MKNNILLIISFLSVSAYCQTLYFIEDTFKDTINKKTFVTALKSIENGKIKILNYFDKRYNFNALKREGNFLLISDPFSNSIYRYSISKQKMLEYKIIGLKTDYLWLSSSKAKENDNIYFMTCKRPLDDDNINSMIDTIYFFKFNFLTKEKKLQGKYINNFFYNTSTENSTKFVIDDLGFIKKTNTLEVLKVINPNLKSITTIDTISFGESNAAEIPDKSYYEQNIQFINDSSILYSIFNWRENYNGFNTFYRYDLNNNKKSKLDLKIDENRAIVGFNLEYKTKNMFINNSEEIYKVDLATNKKTIYYKREKKISGPLIFLIQ